MDDSLRTVIEECTLCIICHHIQLIPSYGTIDGGITVHESCARKWLSTNPTHNLYGVPIVRKTFEPNINTNKMYEYAIAHTTMFDEVIKMFDDNDMGMFSVESIVNFLLRIPKLISLIPGDLLLKCVYELMGKLTIDDNVLKLFGPIFETMSDEQVVKVPVDVFLRYYHLCFCRLVSLDSSIVNVMFFAGCETFPKCAVYFILENPQYVVPLMNNDGVSPLKIAYVFEHYDLFLHFLGPQYYFIRYIDKNILVHAFTENRIKYVKAILDAYRDDDLLTYINRTNVGGENVLSWSIFRGQKDISEFITKKFYNNNMNNALLDLLKYYNGCGKGFIILNYLLQQPNPRAMLTIDSRNVIVKWAEEHQCIELINFLGGEITENKDSSDDIINIIFNDSIYKIHKSYTVISKLINDMLIKSPDMTVIRLDGIPDPSMIYPVLSYLDYHKGITPRDPHCPLQSKKMIDNCHDEWDAIFIDAFTKDEDVLNLINTATRLGIDSLMRLGCAKLATLCL